MIYFFRALELLKKSIESAKMGDCPLLFLAIAFVAGYNVDNFLKKIETVAREIWGIKKSRSSNLDLNNKDES